MKIGIFDSGLGGLNLTHSLVTVLPQYDYIYLGDTKRVPYGNRSQGTIYQFTLEAISYLFEQDCQLIILACNTASAQALRRLQQEYLPQHFADRRILGVIVPTIETVLERPVRSVGILATQSTVHSEAYSREITNRQPEIAVWQNPAPLLVPMIEAGELQWAEPLLRSYIEPLLGHDIETLVLGCTHYALLKATIRQIVGPDICVVSQDEIIPEKLQQYLRQHPEIETGLSKNNSVIFQVTDHTEGFESTAARLFGSTVEAETVAY